jgi:hypothetical protein
MVTPDDAMAAALAEMTGPVVWGASDCCCAASAAFARLHGIDPMADLRGRYADEAGAEALIRVRGGLVRAAARQARATGLRRGRGEAGDLGVVRQGERAALALAVGGGWWAVRIEGGMMTVQGAVRSWRP